MREAVAKAAPELLALSRRIHANPEVAWEEEKAARWTAYALDDLGYEVVTGTAGLPTAFTATVGSGPLHLAICAEYDALPGLGHACGHNVIAAAAVGAAAGLAPVADELGLKVTVFGTPAEEGGGGKILMLERGAFDGVHAAMMVHPGPADVAEADPYAVAHLKVRYHGKAAHAAAYPEQGRNAADAFTIAQVAIGLLRQQLPSSTRVHGMVTRGGEAPNAIPELTEGRWYVRAGSLEELSALQPRVEKCFEAGCPGLGLRSRNRAGVPPVLGVPQRCRDAGRLPAGGRIPRPYLRQLRIPGGPDEPGLHGHGKRLPRPARHPPLPGHQLAARGQPPEGVRGGVRHPGRGPGGPRRRTRHGAHRGGPRGRRPGAGPAHSSGQPVTVRA